MSIIVKFDILKKEIPAKNHRRLHNQPITAESSVLENIIPAASAIDPLCEHHRALFGCITSTWTLRCPCDNPAFQVPSLQISVAVIEPRWGRRRRRRGRGGGSPECNTHSFSPLCKCKHTSVNKLNRCGWSYLGGHLFFYTNATKSYFFAVSLQLIVYGNLSKDSKTINQSTKMTFPHVFVLQKKAWR